MPSSSLTQPPEFSATSINEVLSIADALERAAVARYASLGACMRRVGQDDIARVFESLVAEEQSHVDSVARLSRSLLSAPPSAEIARWVLPETFGTEEAGPPSLLTPYKALSIAVRAEERAFAFWTYVASTAANDEIRHQAEQMAKQELFHAAKLRHARRHAFHQERVERRGEAERRSAINLFAVRRAAAQLGTHAADFLDAAADRLTSLGDRDSTVLLGAIAGEIRRGINMSGGVQSEDAARIVRQRVEWSASVGRAGILFEAAGSLERLAERYLAMLETSTDAPATKELELLIDQTTHQIARLNVRLYEAEPSLAAIAAETVAARASMERS